MFNINYYLFAHKITETNNLRMHIFGRGTNLNILHYNKKKKEKVVF